MDIYHSAVLTRTVESLDQPSNFLLDLFFPQVQTEQSEDIHFDVDQSKPRITPYVHPLVAGKVVEDQGFATKTFRPAYVKDKRVLRPDAPLKRVIGEAIGGSLNPMQRREQALVRALTDQLECLTRRMEVMASEALRLGRVTVSGEKYPSVVVDFGRAAGLTVTLTTTARWGESGVKPLDDIETWTSSIQTQSGAVADTVVMDPLSWGLFRKDADVKERMTWNRGTTSTLNLDAVRRGQGNAKGRYVGSLDGQDYYVYQDSYVDEAGATQKMMLDYSVIIGSRTQVEGTRCFGAILDEEAEFMAEMYFTKSWLEKDPSVRYLLTQAAPLMVPYRPNAVMAATVR